MCSLVLRAPAAHLPTPPVLQASYYTHLLSGRVHVHSQPVALRPFLSGVAAAAETQAAGARLAVSVRVSPDLPAAILTDESRLRDALLVGLGHSQRTVTTGLGAPPVVPAEVRAALLAAGFPAGPVALCAQRVFRPALSDSDLSDPFACIADGSRGPLWGPTPPVPPVPLQPPAVGAPPRPDSKTTAVQFEPLSAVQLEPFQQLQPASRTRAPLPPTAASIAIPPIDAGPAFEPGLASPPPADTLSPALQAFIRFEVVCVGLGMPAGETARTLFSPFMQALDPQSLRALRRIPSATLSQSHASLDSQHKPQTTQHQQPVPLPPPAVVAEQPRTELPPTGTIEMARMSSGAPLLGEEAHSGPLPPEPAERPTSDSAAATSPAINVPPVASGAASSDSDSGERELLASTHLQQGLHAHTRHSGLGLPIVCQLVQLLRGYCGVFDDPLELPPVGPPLRRGRRRISGADSGSESGGNSAEYTGGSHTLFEGRRRLRLTRLFVEIPERVPAPPEPPPGPEGAAELEATPPDFFPLAIPAAEPQLLPRPPPSDTAA